MTSVRLQDLPLADRRCDRYPALPLLVPGDPWLYTVARLTLAPLARLHARLEVTGRDHVPARGPALLVANHPSDLDPLLVALPLARTLHFLASSDHYDIPFVGWCMRRLATVSVERGGAIPQALAPAVALLGRGEIVAVFPEPNERRPGSRSPSLDTPGGRRLPPLGAGVAWLALTCRAPVIPVAISGTDELQSGSWRRELPGGWRERPWARVRYGPACCLTGGDDRDQEKLEVHLRGLLADLAHPD